MGGGGLFGGGYEAPTVEKTPTKQATKDVSAGATAAAQDQQERAKRNRGLAASILTVRDSAVGSKQDTLG